MTAKSPEAFRTISEVADWLDRPAHVLRFWESKFTQIKPVKRAGGRRYYRPEDMLLLGGIKKLLHDDGMTIKGAQKVLREQGVRYVSDLSQPLDDDGALSGVTTLVHDAAANLHNAPAAPVAPTAPAADAAPEPAPEQPIAAPFDGKAEQVAHSIDDQSVDDDQTAAAPQHGTDHSAEQIETPDPVMADTVMTDAAIDSQPIDQMQTPPISPSADADAPAETPPLGPDGDDTQPVSHQDSLSESANREAPSPPQPSQPASPIADPVAATALGADIPPGPDPSTWPTEPGLLSQIAALSGPIAPANGAKIAALITRLDALCSHMATARKS
jgi:resuscitation-promoting factor RpfA